MLCAPASLKFRGPKKDDICYATQNRQDAVKVLAANCDLVIVVGSQNSSIPAFARGGCRFGVTPIWLMPPMKSGPNGWLANPASGRDRWRLCAEHIVADVVARLQSLGQGVRIDLQGVPEDVNFPLPASWPEAQPGTAESCFTA